MEEKNKNEIPQPFLTKEEKVTVRGILAKIATRLTEEKLDSMDCQIYEGLHRSHKDLKEVSQLLARRVETRCNHALKEAALLAYIKMEEFGFDKQKWITLNGKQYEVVDGKVTEHIDNQLNCNEEVPF